MMRIRKLKKLRLTLLIILSVVFAARIVSAQDEEPLNFSNVETALRSTKATSANKNALLIEGVNTRKITFWLTPENEKKLRSWGANDALIEAVRKNQLPMYPMIQKDLKTLNKPLEIKNSTGMEFVLIPAGEFVMGFAKDEKDVRIYEGTPPHNIKIKKEFYLGKFEVTQGQWKALMGKNPSNFQDCGSECPVENIKWNEAQAFIKKLNEKNDGFRYRLPSEAEWEYAARARATTKYYWGEDPDRKNWQYYAHHTQLSPAKVGSYLPNAFGLFDMSGNVWEMCEDVWRRDFANATDDSSPNLEGDKDRRVIKGGSWGQSFDELRTSKRNDIFVDDAKYSIGFRIAAIPIDPLTVPKTITDDNLNSKATTPLIITSGIKGEVKVAVFVDENGKVLTAKAISGHPLLTEKAITLAKEAKFKEMTIEGKPVRVQGTLIYTFK
jgi:formylglycine-generating enzyme required for sulfatase activity